MLFLHKPSFMDFLFHPLSQTPQSQKYLRPSPPSLKLTPTFRSAVKLYRYPLFAQNPAPTPPLSAEIGEHWFPDTLDV